MKSTKNSGLRIGKLKRTSVVSQLGKTFWISIIVILMGFALPQITVCGVYSPLAVGLTASVSGAATVPVFLASFIGYLLKDFSLSLRYISALIAVVGLRWSASGFPRITCSPYFSPSIAFIASLITGSALSLTPPKTFHDVGLIVAESAITAGFSFVCSLFLKENTENIKFRKESEISFGTITIICILIMFAFAWEWQGISLGRIITFILILISIQSGGLRGALIISSFIGMSIFLCNVSQIYIASVCTIGGVLAGAFFSKNKVASLVIFIMTDIVVRLSIDMTLSTLLIIDVYEMVVAFLLTYVMPRSVLQYISKLTGLTNTLGKPLTFNDGAAIKMKKAANTMSQVAGVVNAVSRELSTIGSPNVGSLYQSMAEGFCRSCKKRFDCWEASFSDTMDSFNHMTEQLETEGKISSDKVVGYLKKECIKLDDICRAVSEAYQEFLIRESAFKRLYELNGIVNDQFENTARILLEFSRQCENVMWNDAQTASAIEKELKKCDNTVQSVMCRIDENGRMEIETFLTRHCAPEDISSIYHLVEEVSKRKFSPPIIECEEMQTRILFSEGQAFHACIGAAQSKCKGEKLCGDSFEIFRDSSGNQYVVLSDGMGTGGRAAVDGAMAAGLTAELLKAGFGYESILSIVNTALMTKSEDESLATLDVACINLFTGELRLLKAGAGVSLLLSKERISHFSESSLPLGILRELSFACTCDRLVSGDVLLLMSDGISNNDIRWVEDLLRSFDVRDGNVQALSQKIVDTAKCINDEDDDMTVIAIRLEKQ